MSKLLRFLWPGRWTAIATKRVGSQMGTLPHSFEYDLTSITSIILSHRLYEAGPGYALYGYQKRPYYVYREGKWLAAPGDDLSFDKDCAVPSEDTYLVFGSLEELVAHEKSRWFLFPLKVIYHE